MSKDIKNKKIDKIIKDFYKYILDENGNPKESVLDHAFEDDTEFPGYLIRLYIDKEVEDPVEHPDDFSEYWEGICTYVELRTASDEQIASSSCYGWAENDIATEIEIVLMDMPKNKAQDMREEYT